MYGGKSGNRILHSGVMEFLQGFELRSQYTLIPGKTGKKIGNYLNSGTISYFENTDRMVSLILGMYCSGAMNSS